MSAPEPASHLARLEAENTRLRRAVEELSVLNDVATAIASAASLEAIVDLVVQKCVKHLAVDQGAVLMFGKKDEAAALHTMVRKVQTDLRRDPYRLSEQVVGWMLKNQEPLVINDVAADERFREPTQQSTGVVTSLMCVPLRLKGRMIGVLSVFNKKGSGFTESDQRLGTIIAAQSAQVIEHARLVEEEKALQVMQRELEMAHVCWFSRNWREAVLRKLVVPPFGRGFSRHEGLSIRWYHGPSSGASHACFQGEVLVHQLG